MSNKLKTKKILPNEVLNSEVPLMLEEQNPLYVVVRNGLRVSDRDYQKQDDTRAVAEREFWQRVVNRWEANQGTKIEIVPFDKKKHRIW